MTPNPEPRPAVAGPLRTCIVTGETRRAGADDPLRRRAGGRRRARSGAAAAGARHVGDGPSGRRSSRPWRRTVRQGGARCGEGRGRPAGAGRAAAARAARWRDLGRARRAGRAVAGFVKVEQMIGRQRAGLLIVADEADGDGLGKAAGERPADRAPGRRGRPGRRLRPRAGGLCGGGARRCVAASSFSELRAGRRAGAATDSNSAG